MEIKQQFLPIICISLFSHFHSYKCQTSTESGIAVIDTTPPIGESYAGHSPSRPPLPNDTDVNRAFGITPSKSKFH